VYKRHPVTCGLQFSIDIHLTSYKRAYWNDFHMLSVFPANSCVIIRSDTGALLMNAAQGQEISE